MAGALKQNTALESLVLRHNKLGEGGEVGFSTICKAVRDSKTLKHFDLRHNNLSGAPAAACIGELLQQNSALSHLELSWNRLGATGGQVLLDHLRQNTTLFDCQLTGCGIAEETLLEIAQVLKRNRIAHGASMQAGPYRAVVQAAIGTPRGLGGGGGLASTSDPVAQRPHALESSAAATVVSSTKTQELKEQLLVWRHRRMEIEPNQSFADMQELFDALSRAEAEANEEIEAAAQLRKHLDCLMRGFQDRVMRYQSDIEGAQDQLQAYKKEHKELRAIHTRASEELKLQREATELARESLASDQRRCGAEEARSKNDLANMISQKEACAERLRVLQENCEKQEAENAQLRVRAGKIRSGLVILQSDGIRA